MDNLILVNRRKHGADRIVFRAMRAGMICDAMRFTARGHLAVTLWRPMAPNVRVRLVGAALEQLDALEAIDETLAQAWPRCVGITPSAAADWHEAGFVDAQVVAWLEAGVPLVGAAADLDRVGIEPREIMREHDAGVTLGLAFARAEVSLDQVQLLVLGEEART